MVRYAPSVFEDLCLVRLPTFAEDLLMLQNLPVDHILDDPKDRLGRSCRSLGPAELDAHPALLMVGINRQSIC